MTRRFRPTFETLENREVFSANPVAAAPTVEPISSPAAYTATPYVDQLAIARPGSNQQQIIAILIG
jgi:hypothetical protein